MSIADQATDSSATDATRPGPSDTNITDLRVRQFGVVCGYLQYENTVYWTRSQLFLVANAALIGFLANALPLSTDVPWARIYTLACAVLLALVLCILWYMILNAAHEWIEHWHKQLVHLEPMAFPSPALTSDGLFVEVERNERKWPIKKLSRLVVASLIVIWLLALLFLAIVGLAKYCNMDIA